MPGFDGKGPQGEGPMTGRKAGKCTKFGAGRAGKAVQEESQGRAEKVEQTGTGRSVGRGPGARRGVGLGTGGGRGGGKGTGRGTGAGRGAYPGAGSGSGRGR